MKGSLLRCDICTVTGGSLRQKIGRYIRNLGATVGLGVGVAVAVAVGVVVGVWVAV